MFEVETLHVGEPLVQYMDYKPRGACKEIFKCKQKELIIDGPFGTGKSRACLEKVNFCCEKYPNLRAAMVRKTRRSLTQSGIVTFEKRVMPYPGYIPFHGMDQEYRYPNGSIMAVGGMDDPKKLYSSEWDIVYVQQAEELEESDWEGIEGRLRFGVMGYHQLLGDCNPDAPEHWIPVRERSGKLRMLQSRHEDNPLMWDEVNRCWTASGLDYLATLDALTGARYRRHRLGQWASAEGAVYEESWDKARHVIDRFVTADLTEDQVPTSWPRIWAVDFGFTNPFVWAALAKDPDGRLFVYKQIYRTKTLVEDHCREILRVTKNEPKPIAIICDHDAEDRATMERHLNMTTKAAWKSISPGIQAVEARLRVAGDGKPRIFFLRDSLISADKLLVEAHKPCKIEDEFDVYVWPTKKPGTASTRLKAGEQPVKENDHGMDLIRYVVAEVDQVWKGKNQFFAIGSVTRSDSSSGGGSLYQPSAWRMGGGSLSGKLGGNE